MKDFSKIELNFFIIYECDLDEQDIYIGGKIESILQGNENCTQFIYTAIELSIYENIAHVLHIFQKCSFT